MKFRRIAIGVYYMNIQRRIKGFVASKKNKNTIFVDLYEVTHKKSGKTTFRVYVKNGANRNIKKPRTYKIQKNANTRYEQEKIHFYQYRYFIT